MNNEWQILKEILLTGHYVTEEDIIKAEEVSQARHESGLSFLLSEGLLTRSLLGQAIAEYRKLPYWDLEVNPILKEEILKIPEDISRKNRVIYVKEEGAGIYLASDSIQSVDAIPDEIKRIFGLKSIRLFYVLKEELDAMLHYYVTNYLEHYTQILREEEHAIPRLLERIFVDAIEERASDVHIEPQETEVILRWRIDGDLQEVARLPIDVHENIINRVKVQSGMRTDEHLSAQDGAIRVVIHDTPVDIRASVVPTLNGEAIALRFLTWYVRSFSLGELGLSAGHERMLLHAAEKPFGMILVTGPTGSGKTTTLYALIRHLNDSDVNIMTIEDPAEYHITGINQIQVNQETNLTFAAGLRSIVRQDPDIILVGEIRDIETAEIAVNAALTGHLLFSTFHSNDAATAVPRLIDMGMESFLLASSLELIIAQRLVRKICSHCRVSVPLDKNLLKRHKLDPRLVSSIGRFYKGRGCSVCRGTGVHGRIAIFEMISVSDELRAIIQGKPSSRIIHEQIKKEGQAPMLIDGLQKVADGLISLDELLHVISVEGFEFVDGDIYSIGDASDDYSDESYSESELKHKTTSVPTPRVAMTIPVVEVIPTTSTTITKPAAKPAVDQQLSLLEEIAVNNRDLDENVSITSPIKLLSKRVLTIIDEDEPIKINISRHLSKARKGKKT